MTDVHLHLVGRLRLGIITERTSLEVIENLQKKWRKKMLLEVTFYFPVAAICENYRKMFYTGESVQKHE